jgi:DNA repair protein RadC
MEHRINRMKDIPRAQRPYERMEQSGAASLSDAELLSIVIRNGRSGENSLDLSSKVLGLDISGIGLSFLYSLTVEELTSLAGIGKVKAMQIKAAAEIGRRAGIPACFTGRAKVAGPEDVAKFLFIEMSHLPREELRVVCLDVRNRLIRTIRISEGGLFAAVVSPRDIFREVIKANAPSIVFAHNHPSGDPEPSKEDGDSTRRMIKAGELLGIHVLDHLVIAAGGYVSLKQRGII